MNTNKSTDRRPVRSGVSALNRRSETPPGLRHRRQFLDVQRSGVRRATPGFVLQVGELRSPDGKEGGSALRIGYTVSRKVGNAVTRNRVKRRLRVLGRLVLAGTAQAGRDYVLIGRRGALHRSFSQLAADLEGALKKLDLDQSGNKKSDQKK